MDKYKDLNDVLVRLFNKVMDIEGKAITSLFTDLTNNDMHVIAAIGIDKKKSMGRVASMLMVTTGTLTIAVNGLVKKGYVTRARDSFDRRVVNVRLTEKGAEAYKVHKQFHDDMIAAMVKDLDEHTITHITNSLLNIDKFLDEKHYSSESAKKEKHNRV